MDDSATPGGPSAGRGKNYHVDDRESSRAQRAWWDGEARDYVMALGYLQAPVVVAGDEHWSGFRPDRIKAAGNPALDLLTPRETEVLTLVATGLSNDEITTELRVSVNTVKTHISHILTKLDLRDRVHMVITAYNAGLVQPSQDID